MFAKDGMQFQESGKVKVLTPEEGEKAAREAMEYRQRNADKEVAAEKERRARYGRKEDENA